MLSQKKKSVSSWIVEFTRKINPKCFCALPGIIIPSFGLAMQGLIGIIAGVL